MYPRKPQHKLPSKHRPSTLWMLFAPEMKTNLHQPNAKLSKKLRELVDRENLDPRRSFTKKRYWNHEQHFQREINPEERQLRLHTKTRQNPSIS